MTTKDIFRPSTFETYVGQEGIKRKLKIHMDAAREEPRPLDHVLLVGEPGYGKTALAHLIADGMEVPCTPCDLAKMTPTEFASFIRRFDGGVLFIDEVHRAKRSLLEELLTLAEEEFVVSPSGARIYAPWLTLILATTEPQMLPQALKDRFLIQPRFVDYTEDEMAQIVLNMAAAAELHMPDDLAGSLGKAAAGTPRLCRNLVMAYRDLAYQGEPTLKDVLDLAGIDENGLTAQHIEYLQALERLDGISGEAQLCNVLRTTKENLHSLERVLFKRNMVVFTPKGRALTAAGDATARGLKPRVFGRRA
jgi:Holliday junction DNA helicase RuvB